MRRGVDGVRPRESAGAVRELDDPANVGERADCVRRDREGDDARAGRELSLEVGEIDVAVVRDVGEAHDEAEVMRQLEPRRDVAVVIEARDDDLVAGLPRPRGGAGERKRQRGHVRAERHLLGRAAEETAGGRPCLVDDAHRPRARLEGPAKVRVRFAQIGRDGVDHLVGHLRPAGPVEQHEIAPEGAVAPPNGLDVERNGRHVSTLTMPSGPGDYRGRAWRSGSGR